MPGAAGTWPPPTACASSCPSARSTPGRTRATTARSAAITFYNLVSDQFTGLNGITVPGTLRDSLTLLSVVLEQQTELQPTEIMSDTGAYTDTIFGIFHLLGFEFSPRLADIGGTRFWRVDGRADYGALDGLAAQRINVALDHPALGGPAAPRRLAQARHRAGRGPDPNPANQGPPDQAGPRAGGAGPPDQDPLPAPLHRRRGLPAAHPGAAQPRRGPSPARPRRLPRQARRTAAALPRGSGGPARRARPGGERHRAVEHDLHGRGA